MNRIILCSIFILVATIAHSQSLQVMSYNLRFDNPQDGVNQWSARKDNVYSLIKKYNPDVMGIQEGLQNQLEDIKQHTGLDYVGVGRDDGKSKGEYSAIFFRRERLEVLEQNTFWLSESPAEPGSKSWDAAITRVATWAKLKDLKTRKTFVVINTHFDHIGKTARMKSAELIKQKIKAIAGDLPVIVTGDFNAEPTEPPYSIMTSNEGMQLFDAGRESKEGTYCTFVVGSVPCKRIDYIFHSAKAKSNNFSVISDNDGKHYPSDHLPIQAKLKIR